MKKRTVIIRPDDDVVFDKKCIGKHTRRGMYTGSCNGKELIDLIEEMVDKRSMNEEKLLIQISNLKHALMNCLEDDETKNRIVGLIAEPKEHPRDEEWM